MMLPPDEFDEVEIEPYDVPRGVCPRCGSSEVRHIVIGLPAGPEVMEGTPEWVAWVGCDHPGYDRECHPCGLAWTSPHDGALELIPGEIVEAKGRRLRVSELDLVTLHRVRELLITVAGAGSTMTYGAMIEALALPHPPNGLGRLLDLLSEDCFRRGVWQYLERPLVQHRQYPEPVSPSLPREW